MAQHLRAAGYATHMVGVRYSHTSSETSFFSACALLTALVCVTWCNVHCVVVDTEVASGV